MLASSIKLLSMIRHDIEKEKKSIILNSLILFAKMSGKVLEQRAQILLFVNRVIAYFIDKITITLVT